MVHPVLTKAFLQPAKAAAVCTAPRAETCVPLPILPFLLAQILSSKRIAPTDNMRPKSDNAIWHHRCAIPELAETCTPIILYTITCMNYDIFTKIEHLTAGWLLPALVPGTAMKCQWPVD